MAVKTIFLKRTMVYPDHEVVATFSIPNDFSSLVSVEAIGGGGTPSYTTNYLGMAGGAYAKTTSITGLSAGQTVYYLNQPGRPNGLVWLSTTGSAPTSSSQGVKAVGGNQTSGGGGTGGPAASCIGSTTYSGGNSYYGGGGAAGPNGAGGSCAAYNRGGGGANGGTNAKSNNDGGDNRNGSGAGVAATSTSAATSGADGGGGGSGLTYSSAGHGSQDSVWAQSSNGELAGPGGGGGGLSGSYSPYKGGNGGGYGGGGGGGAIDPSGDNGAKGSSTQGIIVFTYNAIDPTITITSQPQNKTVITGEAATFSITATIDLAGYSLNYQWQKAESTDPYTWTNITGATSSSYTTGLAEAGYSSAATDGDKYRCVLGVGGTSITAVSDAAILTVIKGGNFFMMF